MTRRQITPMHSAGRSATSGQWHTFRCPTCHSRHVQWVKYDSPGAIAPADAGGLSLNARRLLKHAPASWRRGNRSSIRTLAGLAGMSYHSARKALLELVREGCVRAVPYGRRTQYVAIPTMIRDAEERMDA